MTNNELISTLDFDSLLCKLSSEESLSPREIEALEQCITFNIKGPRARRNLEDLYAALTVISKSNLSHLSYLAEMCLDVPDPVLVCLALETLAIEWHIGKNYEERLIQFALGVPSDHDGDIRECAIKCLGVLLEDEGPLSKKTLTPTEERLIGILLSVAEEPEEEEHFRKTALQILEETVAIRNSEILKDSIQSATTINQITAEIRKFLLKNKTSTNGSKRSGNAQSQKQASSVSIPSTGGAR